MNLFELTKSLMSIPSVSGEEEAVGFYLRDHLESLGWTVELQQVSENQNNVIAYLNETPRIWLSTHMDTVPPFIGPTEDDEKIYGRGACDAKGIIAAEIVAAEELRREGVEDIGLLYTVEEERASTGAKFANEHPLAAKCEYLINGEPTDNDLAIGSKGAFRAKIKTTGKAAHSAYPEQGDSAIEKLLDILEDVRHTKFPNDGFFGDTTCNIATLDGGLALNVIPPNAESGILIRLTTPMEPIRDALESLIRGRGELEILSYSLPVKMLAVDGFDQKVVRFTTDIPHLPNWGRPLLGPGSILVAHTKDEFVLKKDLETSVVLYRNLVKKLLNAEFAESEGFHREFFPRSLSHVKMLSMKIALIGYGTMGRLIRRLAEEKGHEVVVVIDASFAGASVSELSEKLKGAEVAIDFTNADAVKRNVAACIAAGVPLVEGTTGWSDQKTEIESMISTSGGAFLFGANFSIGVNLFYRIAGYAAELFAKFPEYETFIEEQHHSRKLDSPSGTALKLKDVVAEHAKNDITISATRAGNIPGTHRVGFDGPADQIMLEHTARSREGFAFGAIMAAEWIVGKKGFFEFSEVMDDICQNRLR